MKATSDNRKNSKTPAAPIHNIHRRPLRVAVYCRVGGGVQTDAYQLQTEHYTAMITANPVWEMVGIFFDEGVSGNSKERKEFNRLMRECENGGIDLIVTKSVSRFARNAVDCIGYIRKLTELGIGVIFEKEGLDTLKARDILTTAFDALTQIGKEDSANANSNG